MSIDIYSKHPYISPGNVHILWGTQMASAECGDKEKRRSTYEEINVNIMNRRVCIWKI